jgi:predicted secreted acid phosphatase
MITLTDFTDTDKAASVLSYVKKKLREKSNKRWCAVFDVDDTLIINHPNDDELCKVNPVVSPIVDHLHQEDIPMFIITARHGSEKSLEFLKQQLEVCGYEVEKHFKTPLYMVTQEYAGHLSPGIFKYKARRQISKEYNILLSAGDSWTDLTVIMDEEDRDLLKSNPQLRIEYQDQALSKDDVEAMRKQDTVLFTGNDHFKHGLSHLYLKLPRRD